MSIFWYAPAPPHFITISALKSCDTVILWHLRLLTALSSGDADAWCRASGTRHPWPHEAGVMSPPRQPALSQSEASVGAQGPMRGLWSVVCQMTSMRRQAPGSGSSDSCPDHVTYSLSQHCIAPPVLMSRCHDLKYFFSHQDSVVFIATSVVCPRDSGQCWQWD